MAAIVEQLARTDERTQQTNTQLTSKSQIFQSNEPN